MLRSEPRRGSAVSSSSVLLVLLWIARASALFPWVPSSPSTAASSSPSPASPATLFGSDVPSQTPVLDTPFPTYSEFCYVCDGDASQTVQPGLTTMLGEDEYTCEDLELAGQLRFFDAAGCEIAILLATSDCNCSPSSAVPIPVPAPTPAPSQSPAVDTPFPTASEPCYVCGDPSLSVQPDLTTMLGDGEFTCGDLELAGQLRLFGSDTCPLITILATSDCGCAPDDPVPAPVSPPTTADTSAPTYSEPCYVCGDPDFEVDENLSVAIGDTVSQCKTIQAAFAIAQTASPEECDLITDLVLASCDCRDPNISSPTVDAPVAAPTSRGVPMTEAPVKSVVEESSGGGGGALYALAALALIPLAAGLFVYFKRNNAADESSKPPNPVQNPDASAEEGGGPNAPSAPAPYQPSVTASLQTDDEYQQRPPPVAVATAVSQSTLSGWSGAASTTPSQNDNLHRSVGEASAGSGQSHDPPSSTGGKTAPYASPPAAAPGSGNYLPDVKDQCRSLAAPGGESTMAEAIVVTDAVPAASEQDDRKRAPLDP